MSRNDQWPIERVVEFVANEVRVDASDLYVASDDDESVTIYGTETIYRVHFVDDAEEPEIISEVASADVIEYRKENNY